MSFLGPSLGEVVVSTARQIHPMPVCIRQKKYSKAGRRRDLMERLDGIEGLLEELLARTGPSPRDTIIKTGSPYFLKFLDRARSLAGSRAKYTVKGAARHGLQATTSAEGESFIVIFKVLC
jgi:hypothetical protein